MPRLQSYQQLRFYDPFEDAESVRISGFSGRGEFWCKRIVPPSGAARRAMVAAALALIETAIEAGLEPGEVLEG
jgi:hypothetical protein